MHSLVLRQLRKAGLTELAARADVATFVGLVSDAYFDAEVDRQQLEHSLSMASAEVYERNRQLESEIEQRALLRQRLDDTTQSAEENERKYRALFELAPVGIIAADLRTGKILHMNDAMLALTGYERDAVLRMTYQQIAEPDAAVPEKRKLAAPQRRTQFGPYERAFKRKDGDSFSAMVSGIRTEDESGSGVIWSIVQDISQRKESEMEMAHAARSDKLTGLANRVRFMERLEETIVRVQRGEQKMFAVLFLDFDRFKFINDTLGHAAGDELLQQIAQRLRNTLRATDTLVTDVTGNVVSRFGGDEFLLLINDLDTPADANRIADRLLEALSPSYEIRSREMHSSASIGIITSAQCCSSAEDVVRNADLAMYEAKRAGRARAVLFDESMHTRLTRLVSIEGSLRRAIGSKELYLVYQPIVSLATSAMVSAEALIRWNHPTLGPISPSEFIPIAEESGLIIPLGEWVQREACQALVKWRAQDPRRAPATVSVNVSRAELAQGQRFLVQVRDLLKELNLPPQSLQLEVTEREFVRRMEFAQTLLHELQSLGVKIAMDDFGTGMSSLGFLRSSPFDTIKIDRSFVQDLTDSPDGLAVLHSAVNLIENLGMASVAEGVEEPAQVAILQSLGCRYAQGYLFSRAVPPDQLLDACCRDVMSNVA